MFLTYSRQSRAQSHALEAWREAARVVSARWEMFLAAEGKARRVAFASYLAALDAEEAAAADVSAVAYRAAI